MGFETGTARLAWGIAVVFTCATALCLLPFSFVEASWDQQRISEYVMPAEEGWPDWFRRMTKNLTGEALTEAEFVSRATASPGAIQELLTEEAEGALTADERNRLARLRDRRLFPALESVYYRAHFDWIFFFGWVVAAGISSALLSHLAGWLSIWVWRGYQG